MALPEKVVWCFRRGGGVVGKLRCDPLDEGCGVWRTNMAVLVIVMDGELGGVGDNVLGLSGEMV